MSDQKNSIGVDTSDTAKPSLEEVSQQAAPNRPKRGFLTWLFRLIVLVLIMAVAAGAAFTYWQVLALQEQQLANDRARSSLLDEQRATQELIAMQQQGLAELRQQQQELRQQQRYVQDSANALQRRLLELAHTDRSDWQLAEVEYLLRLAHQRVVSNNNAALGLEVLLSADQLLREIDSADLFVVREQIAADVLALKNAKAPDVEGIFLALGAAAASVDGLSFNQLQLPNNDKTAVPERSLLQQLADLYRVNDRKMPVQPLFSEEQSWLLQQRLKLLLEQSRQAVVTGSPVLYETSLTEAAQLITDYAVDNAVRAGLLGQLDEFAQQNIQPDMPDISGSHAAMRNYMANVRLLKLAEPAVTNSNDAESL